ncbi:hypothetical protein [Hymenobacter sp. BT559]|uniref:hypothetical protein n=1 Tax=Hymenobacter sp. BT559 TaxID=2795729 RepID=UPI0018ECF3F7|nr:hypothetical protein [Hymenobacter sp. BT559]MBJ6145566.1 hypothetical protein [Hymenobacter sp. BT559]
MGPLPCPPAVSAGEIADHFDQLRLEATYHFNQILHLQKLLLLLNKQVNHTYNY